MATEASSVPLTEAALAGPVSHKQNTMKPQKMATNLFNRFMASILPSPKAALASPESSQPNAMQAQEEIGEEHSSSHDELETFIKDKLIKIVKDSEETIVNHDRLRVPEHIKKLNPAAYKPRLISIGPLHHGHSDLQAMEALKIRYAHSFIENYKVKIKDLIKLTEECEEQLRKNYEIDPSMMPSREFVLIMLIDGTFLVEFLCKHHSGSYEEIDRMTHKKWKIFTCDLFLLENQIPYFYLDKVLALAKQSKENTVPSVGLHKLLNIIHSTGLHKLLDKFLSVSVFPQFVYGSSSYVRVKDGGEFPFKHNLDILRSRMDYHTESFHMAEGRQSQTPSCPTISELHRAGIKFRLGDSPNWQWNSMRAQGIVFRSIWSARITFHHGVLQIPRFIIDENTQRYFLNLLAAELSRERDRFATDYIALIDYLIDGPEDVQILVERGIIQNLLEDNKAAACLINEIGKSVDIRRDFRYSRLVEDLEVHCRNRWNKWKFEWKKDLMRNYFGNPWKALSVIAAIILLELTVIQTVCSVLQLTDFKV